MTLAMPRVSATAIASMEEKGIRRNSPGSSVAPQRMSDGILKATWATKNKRTALKAGAMSFFMVVYFPLAHGGAALVTVCDGGTAAGCGALVVSRGP